MRKTTSLLIGMISFVLFSSLVMASYVVVDTNQEDCFDEDGYIPDPNEGEQWYGQDAQVDGTSPSYKDMGDGTVLDLNTGLMWQKTPGEDVNWDDAVSGADDLDLAGYDDWRLPTIKELYSLMDFSGYCGNSAATSDPFLDDDIFDFEYGDESAGERFIDAQYWSSTLYVGETMGGDKTAFGVNFADGRIKGYPAEPVGPPGNQFEKECEAMYVRGPTDYGVNDFIDNGDGTITDNATGLMWAKDDSGSGMNWSDALDYCTSLTLAGHDDWYLPNAKELQGILEYSKAPNATDPQNVGPAIDDVFNITDIGSGIYPDYGFYWSSSTHLDGGTPWGAYVAFGEAWGWNEMPPNSGNYVFTDVHGAGAQRSDPKDGDPSNWPNGNGPQGDIIRIFNMVRPCRVAFEVDPPDFEPEIQTVNDINATEDEEYLVTYTAIDLDENVLTWTVDTDAGFLSMDAISGNLSGTPLNEDVGTYWVNVTVTDTTFMSDHTNFTLEVINVNDDPMILTNDVLDAHEDEKYSVQYSADDIDPTSDNLFWAMSSDAGFLSMTTGGLLSGTPVQADIGTYSVNVSVADGNGGEAHSLFTLTVHNTNDGPRVNNSVDDFSFDEDTVNNDIDLNHWFSDIDGDDLVFTFEENVNISIIILPNETVELTPKLNYNGAERLYFTANDTELEVSAFVDVTVLPVNDEPVNNNFTASVNGTSVALKANTASDVDGDLLTYLWDLGEGNVSQGLETSYTYPELEENMTYTITLTISDGTINSDVCKQTVFIERIEEVVVDGGDGGSDGGSTDGGATDGTDGGSSDGNTTDGTDGGTTDGTDGGTNTTDGGATDGEDGGSQSSSDLAGNALYLVLLVVAVIVIIAIIVGVLLFLKNREEEESPRIPEEDVEIGEEDLFEDKDEIVDAEVTEDIKPETEVVEEEESVDGDEPREDEFDEDDDLDYDEDEPDDEGWDQVELEEEQDEDEWAD